MAITDGLSLSAPVNAVRYDNGTLIKLTASAAGFVSYDYDPETGQGTFKPASIIVRANYKGNISFGKWEYSNDGSSWTDAAGAEGITTTAGAATITPANDLFTGGNLLIIRCTGNDGATADTITITRAVDPLQIYRENHTAIEQTNDKIALIATEEQLREFADGQTTLTTKVATIEETADGFRQTVTRSYATKTDAQGYANSAQSAAISAAATDATNKANSAQSAAISAAASDATTKANNARTGALNDAKGYVNTKLESYSTIEQTSTAISTAVASKTDAGEVRSIITQEADNIRLQARKIAWSSDNSSMTQDGTLTCHNANLDGTITITGATSESKIGTNDTFVYSDFLGVVKRNLENFHYFIKNGTGGIIDSKSWQKFSNMLQETTVTTGKQILRMLCLANGYDDIDTAPAAYLNEVLERFQYDESKDKYVYSLVAPKSSFHMYDTGIYIGYEGGRKYNVPYDIDTESSQSNATVIMLGEKRIRMKAGQTQITANNSATITANTNNIEIKDSAGSHIIAAYTKTGSTKNSTVYLKAEYIGIRLTGNQNTNYELYNSFNRLYFGTNEIQYTSVSSRRYKHDITPELPEDMDPHRLYDLPVVRFTYNDDAPLQYQDTKGKPLIGFIAEDVAEIYPNAVIRNKDGTVESWDERRIIPPMLAMIQEQKKEIENLKAELAELKAIVKEIRDAKN